MRPRFIALVVIACVHNVAGRPTGEMRDGFSRSVFRHNVPKTDSISTGSPSGLVIVNEIMYAPTSPEPEWIELINAGPDSVNIAGWQIRDLVATPKTITESTHWIGPEMFLLLTRDGETLHAVHPDITTRMVTVPGFPSLNNGGDAVVLLDSGGRIVDSLSYAPSWGGSGGTSLERIDRFSPSTTALNWSSSEDASGSTPGRKNSVAIADSDLAVSIEDTVFASARSSARIPVVIRNRGRQPAKEYTVEFFDDSSRNGIGDPDEFVGRMTRENAIAPGDSVLIQFVWDHPVPGRHQMIGTLHYDNDQRLANNVAIFMLAVGYPSGSVVINEIMFDPLPGNAEFLEIMNLSAEPVEIGGWAIIDRPRDSGTRNTVHLGSSAIGPGQFFVVASDSSILRLFPGIPSYQIVRSSLSLNNDGDAVVLVDQTGEIIDSVAYDPSWHNPDVRDATGRSLERINPFLGSNDTRNWNTCAIHIGGTPGFANSLYSPRAHRASRLHFSPNPFSPDGDGVEDVVIIHYELQLPVSLMSVRIYDARGRLIRRLANIEPSGPRGDIIWDGRDDNREIARIGMYVAFLEAIDERGGVIETVKGVVVLAARLN